MATIKLTLDQNYTKKGKESDTTYPLVIKVSHRSKWKNIQMGFQLKLVSIICQGFSLNRTVVYLLTSL